MDYDNYLKCITNPWWKNTKRNDLRRLKPDYPNYEQVLEESGDIASRHAAEKGNYSQLYKTASRL